MALTAVISDALMIEGSHLRKIRSQAHIKPEVKHDPPAVTEDEEVAILRLIREGHSSESYDTQREVLNFVEIQFGKCRTYQ
jgi:DNA-binding NarL/FixJ family response regulator